MVLAGAGAGTVWMLLFGLLAGTARGYCWLTIAGALTAWLAALGLVRFGDRGVAAGVALAAGVGLAVAGVVVTVSWAYGNWLLW